ncbi:MAG: PaREP1 family protein [Aigarchaeota archaeon]|nr:PaREP1 family protein [Candidatus Pelearchaeum maunauluense]
MPSFSVSIPENLAEGLRSRGVDIDSYVVELIIRELRLDPRSEAEAHLELSRRFLREASDLLNRDSVQASEKLHKAAEEAVKALAVAMSLQD